MIFGESNNRLQRLAVARNRSGSDGSVRAPATAQPNVGRKERRMRWLHDVPRLGVGVAAGLIFVLAAQVCEAETVSECGTVTTLFGCAIFETYDDGTPYLLPDSLAPTYSTTYHVTGDSYALPWRCGPLHFDQRLRNVILAPCPADTLGCGVIVRTGVFGCSTWQSLQTAEQYLILELGGFAVGDTVRASGIRCQYCGAVPAGCGEIRFLQDMRLLACRDTLNPVLDSSWGKIKSRFLR